MKIAIKETVQKALAYTRPRPTTACNFEEPQLFQAGSSAAIEGFYMLGLSGALTNSAATVAGLAAHKKLGKLPGVLVGVATGAVLAGAAAAIASPAGLATLGSLARSLGIPFASSASAATAATAATAASAAAATAATAALTTAATTTFATAAAFGGLVAAYSTLRGNPTSKFRDAGAFGLSFGSPLLHGPAKAGLGIASALAAEFDNEAVRGLVAGGLGAAAGVAFSLTGHAPFPPAVAALACAGVSAFGAVGGPRIGMVMRNLTEDVGQKMVKNDQPVKEKSLLSRTAGVVPMAAVRQTVMAALMGRFDPTSVATGFALDAGMSAYEIYLTTKNEKKPEK